MADVQALQFPADVRRTWRQVERRHLTYSKPRQLLSLLRLCQEMELAKEPGIIIEAGCARGGSSILLCAMKSRHRPFRVYDVFGEIPPPSDQDGADMQERHKTIASGAAVGLGGQTHYSYEPDLYALVRQSFIDLGHPPDERNVSFIKGKVQDTLHVAEPVCLAHIDVDWYEPVTACLERIVPELTPRGALVIRAYKDWSGARKATDEYFDRAGRDQFMFDDSTGHLVVRYKTEGWQTWQARRRSSVADPGRRLCRD